MLMPRDRRQRWRVPLKKRSFRKACTMLGWSFLSFGSPCTMTAAQALTSYALSGGLTCFVTGVAVLTNRIVPACISNWHRPKDDLYNLKIISR